MSVISTLSRETAIVLLQLCLWSELGVLTRIYLDRLFNDGCDDGWGLCLTSERTTTKQYGAEFFDLPANMLGCFVMGLLSTGAVLGLKTKKTLAILPASHHFQGEKELQVGLRTGYCGSLTTFASWELSLLQLLIGSTGGNGGQWQQWLWGYIIGFELAYASHLIGEHAALCIHRWLLPEGSKEPEEEITEMERPTEAQAEGEDLYGNEELNDVLGDRQQQPDGHQHDGQETRQDRNKEGKTEMTDLERPTEAPEEGEDLYGTADSHQVLTASQSQRANGHAQPGQDLERATHPRHRSHVKPANGPKAKSSGSSKKPAVNTKLSPSTICCGVLCLLLTVLWVVLAIVDSERKHAGRRTQWFALLFAPFGCTLRWLLSKLNTKEYPILPWFPFGTFAANMMACSIDFIIGGLTNRYTLGYWPLVILPAIRVGYAGSLSTVSTFIAEVRQHQSLRCSYAHSLLHIAMVDIYGQSHTWDSASQHVALHFHLPVYLLFVCRICMLLLLHSFLHQSQTHVLCLFWCQCHLLGAVFIYAGVVLPLLVFLQVRAQLQGWPEKVHGYLYPFITIATGNVLGIILYGWSVWRTM